MKIINAFPGMGDNDWRRDEKFYVNNNNLLIRIGLKDEEGEPNVIPLSHNIHTAKKFIMKTAIDGLQTKN